MKTLLIGLMTTLSLSTMAQDSIRFIGTEVGGQEQCELQLRGDYEQDAEGVSINDAAISNKLTDGQPVSFDAYIGNNGHNWYMSIGHKNLQLKFDEELNVTSYVYRQDNQTVNCDLTDAELVLDF